ncbi:hypothetical protein DFH28DRAFT_1080611 [Melampsora americana]|nr:hypothetical protein DFH28DRAFT_1080611 [Melampsora americana]
MNSTTNSMSNNLHQSRLSSNLNQSLPASTLPSSIRQEQAQQAQPPPTQHRRSHSLNLAAALNRRVSKKNQLPGQVIGNQTGIHTLPIIQPDPYWNSYQNNRHFKINLRQPRQQVTSLLALSSIPRPITPPLHEDLEPNVTTLIENVTRLVMEEEATNAAIAASLQTLENEHLSSSIPSMNQDHHHHPSPLPSSLPTSQSPTLQSPTLQSPILQSPEVFVIVRPPPSKANHPLNLQVQLVLPNLPHHPASLHQNVSSNSDLRRTPSVRSGHSSRSNTSMLSMSNSEASRRGRRVTPLYNLQCHTVLPTWISDAGTDAKIAKFLKKGIELFDFGIIESVESQNGVSNLNLVNLIKPISHQIIISNPSLDSHQSISNKSDHEPHSFNGPVNWFKRIKTIGSLGTKRVSMIQPKMMVNEAEDHDGNLPDRNESLSSNGAHLGSKRRMNGFVWMITKWLREDPPESTVLIEWRKGQKSKRKKHVGSLGMIDSTSNQTSSSRRDSIQVTGEADLRDPNLPPPPSSHSRIEEEREQEEGSDEESDVEDSERPWHCDLVVIKATDPIDSTQAKRTYLGSLTPQPHHPRLVGKLIVPWKLEGINPDEDSKRISIEELKDLMVTTSMWLIVREELGRGGGRSEEGGRRESQKGLNSNLIGFSSVSSSTTIGTSLKNRNRNRNSISIFGTTSSSSGGLNPDQMKENEGGMRLNSKLKSDQSNRKSLMNWSKIGKF